MIKHRELIGCFTPQNYNQKIKLPNNLINNLQIILLVIYQRLIIKELVEKKFWHFGIFSLSLREYYIPAAPDRAAFTQGVSAPAIFLLNPHARTYT